MAEAWRKAIGQGPLKLIVHAGHNSLEEAKSARGACPGNLAQTRRVMAPCYFKPATVEDLLEFCAPLRPMCSRCRLLL